jgi:adenine phosphoribosyltransferase
MSSAKQKTSMTQSQQSRPNHLPMTAERSNWLKNKIRSIPNFPKAGINFKDLTTLLKDAEAFKFVIDALAEKFAPYEPSFIAGVEARGFILGAALAYEMGIGFLPIRKPGKLPYQVEKISYELEYGTDSLEIHVDAVANIDAIDSGAVEIGRKVVLVDDLLATGGTAAAAHDLLKSVGADVIGVGFVVELSALAGRKKFSPGTEVFSLLEY